MTTTAQPSSTQQADPQPALPASVKAMLTALWWLPLIRGIFLIIFGLLLFLRPVATLTALFQVLGAYWLVSGTFDIVEGIIGHAQLSRTRLIIGGLLSVLAGFFMIGQPLMAGLFTATFIVYLVGITIILAGVMQIVALPKGSWTWRSLLLSLLSILFGLFLLVNPLVAEITLVRFLPMWAIFTGISAIWIAFSLRRLPQSNGL